MAKRSITTIKTQKSNKRKLFTVEEKERKCHMKRRFLQSTMALLLAAAMVICPISTISAFAGNEDGYSWLRVEIYKIAVALGANEVWYVAELATDEMDRTDFSFEEWLHSLKNGEHYVSELSVDVLKDKYICTYYHDDFSDIILERPCD